MRDVFDDKFKASKKPEIDLKQLHAKIAQLTLTSVFWKARSTRPVCCRVQRHDGSLQQAKPRASGQSPGSSRFSLHYARRPASQIDLKLMHRIDELHMVYPFAGSRMMKGLLRQEDITV
ncbi:MAG: hypothetical protein V2I76_14975 [Roseobacter sp.]|nr:hypothetical protein [Roseobacter sp.]